MSLKTNPTKILDYFKILDLTTYPFKLTVTISPTFVTVLFAGYFEFYFKHCFLEAPKTIVNYNKEQLYVYKR